MPLPFLIRHWKKELQVFHENLLILQKSSNTEALHDIRVSIKKLRSYTKLFSEILNKDPKNLFVETKNLFSVLGRQRNIEISLELLDRFKAKGSHSSIQKHFEFYLNEIKQQSISALHQYKADGLRSLTIEIEKTISTTDEGSLKPGLLKLMRSSVIDIKRQSKNFDKNFHLIRKKLKDIFYWSEILPEGFYFSKQELKQFKTILSDLGDSQDHEVLRSGLQHYRKTVIAKGSAEYDKSKKLEDDVFKIKQNALGNAGRMIHAVFKSK